MVRLYSTNVGVKNAYKYMDRKAEGMRQFGRHLCIWILKILWRNRPVREVITFGGFREREYATVAAGASCLPSLSLAPGRGRVTAA
jgi:hypothetical protein